MQTDACLHTSKQKKSKKRKEKLNKKYIFLLKDIGLLSTRATKDNGQMQELYCKPVAEF